MSVTGLSITACLHEISSRLTDAAAIGKAALVCAESGSEREGLRIAMDLDELLHQVQTLHGAVCLIGRISRQDDLRSVVPG
jgi:glycerol-3-phosphate O-acyltransferase